MKKIFAILAITILTVTACKKDKTVSHVVTVPTVKVNGDKFITINVGGTMPEDAGATVINDEAISGGSNIMASENNVDVNTPGIYYMLYQTQTKNGYTVGAARYIAVTNYTDAEDLTGTYVRTANDVPVELTRKSRALYENNDMGGAGLSDAIYFAVINDSTIVAGPEYSETLSTVIDTKNAELHIEPGNTYFQYILIAPGYGTPLRKFVKE
ncbi:MAG: immunoglobulin-like domain-containing protein [Flavipsychrobacter sp.]